MNQINNLHLRVIAITVDTKKITLYDEKGDTHTLQQGDPRVPAIIKHAVPLVNNHKVAVVDMTVPKSQHYQDVEEKSSGLVKLFRVAKRKVQELFERDEDEDTSVLVFDGGIQQEKSTSVDEVMKHAIPTSDERFYEAKHQVTRSNVSYDKAKEDDDTTTICAVVDGVVIPGVENLERYLQRASNMGSYEGVLNFLRRVAKVINERNHSIEDLFRFLERADLPIADDGSIIIYKVLRKHPQKEGYFTDCHTGNVPQRAGSFVVMDASMVDHNRRKECSNGLHVARRGYIRCFPGDVCFMGKLAPEDVIAVPHYDANKMRVCGYHLLFELSSDMYSNLRDDKPITSTDAGKLLLGRALAGDHPRRIENIRITEQRGKGIVIEPLNEDGSVVKDPVKVTPTEALPDTIEKAAAAEPVDFNEINAQKVSASADELVCDPAYFDNDKDAQSEETPVELNYNERMRKVAIAKTRKERITALVFAFHADDASEIDKQVVARRLQAEKKQAKVSYAKLGIVESVFKPYLDMPTSTKAPEPKKKATKVSPLKGTKVPYSQTTSKEQAADLWLDFQTAPDTTSRKQAAIALSNFKRSKKVSWEKLGLNKSEVENKIKHLLD